MVKVKKITEENRIENQPFDVDVIPEPVHPTKRSKLVNYLVAAALIIVALGLLRIFVWSFDNEPVLTVNNSPFPTRTIREHPTGGGVVFLTADYCKTSDIEGDLRVSFLAQTREVFLPITKERTPKGCHKVELPIVIPKDIAPGEYKIKFRVTYDKNPLKQNEVVEFESQKVIIDPTTP